ncbi:MAG: tRNA pseudouridine(55) synthase TruB [Myxococcales bacterium]|nr:tRNA pseudouridine(55) synthase TruB [Myxococcales bacterium]USN50689.1 MAG: tRNA pseudouridine(55) synthase TruB [Myxococcales bacterium]
MEGILLVDKPVGPSSFDVVRAVQRLSKQKRIGHAGTLDPLASGLLVICLGRYTKFASFLTNTSKVYESIFTLGKSTTTDDAEGEIIEEKSIGHLSESDINDALMSFKGKIEQAPPQFSAIKINGQRAYKMARDNQEFEITPRSVELFELVLMAINLPQISIGVHCSKGTYIRALARDLGEKLGTGAFASQIRRIKSGNYCIEDALSLNDLDEESIAKTLKTGREAVGTLPIVELDEKNTLLAKHGKQLEINASFSDCFVGFFQSEPIAILKNENSAIKIVRGI